MKTLRTEEIRERVLALVAEGRHAEAIDVCEDALTKNSADDGHRLLHYRATIEWELGQHEAALTSLRAAQELCPEWAGHSYQACLWLLELGRYSAAYDEADRLLKIEETRGSIAFVDSGMMLKAFALAHIGDMPGAMNVLRLVNDERPMWIAGRLIGRGELLAFIQRS